MAGNIQRRPAPAPVFDALERTPHNHFRLHLYAAVHLLTRGLIRHCAAADEGQEGPLAKYPFLDGYLSELAPYLPELPDWGEAALWWEAQLCAWEEGAGVHLPLRALAAEGGVDFLRRMALLTVGLPEEDSRFGTLFAGLQPRGQRRATWELAGRLVGGSLPDGEDPWRVCLPLLHRGLVEVINREAPRAEWELFVPAPLWEALRDCPAPESLPWCRYRPAGRGIPGLNLPGDVAEQLLAIPALVRDGRVRTLVLRGSPGSERAEIIGAVASELGRGVLEVEAAALATDRRKEHLGPLCLLSGTVPVIVYDLAPGESAEIPDLTGYPGLVGVALGTEGGLTGRRAERATSIRLPAPNRTLRRRYWEQALPSPCVDDLDGVSARFHLSGLHIRQVAAAAATRAAMDRRETVTLSDVQAACRDLNRQLLDTLATRIEAQGSWANLVVSEQVGAQLRELELRCRHRETVLDHLGPAFGGARSVGVRAVFDGPSGTGKTLAARTLAAVLQMDIYRVDLAAVVNKYIGETEKNLSQLLSRAEELDVILLLDEGDSLLARRSEVKSSNDRHANMETNYLLQRLEYYQGIVLVTTNSGSNIDPAFQRRMDAMVSFAPPQPRERLAIWRLHLQVGHGVEAGFLEQVAVRCSLTGGQIRNAALKATLLSLETGEAVSDGVLLEAVRAEYKKAGSISPM